MLKKTSAILFLSFIAASLLLVSCGGNSGGSSGAVPEVVVDPGSNPVDGNPAAGTVVINPEGGNLDINGESISLSDYPAVTVTATDGTGNCIVTVSDDGIISIKPADGSVEGTYTVTINTGDREYVIIIEVNANGDPVVTTCISYPSGSSMILDLNDGTFVNTLNGNTVTVTDDGFISGYTLAADIIVTGPGGSAVSVTVDPLTGDIIASGDISGPYTIVITTSDGSVITLTTDNNGKITAVIENNSTLILNLNNGAVSSSGYNISLTSASGDGAWSLADGVQVLSVTAAGGAIQQIDTARIWINQINGDIMIAGSNGLEPPVGPYEIKVSAGNSVYVIKTDTNGQVVSILPGNVLLQLSQGVITYSGNNVLAIANNSNGWILSGAITGLAAVDASGRGLNISIDPVSGNLVTDANVTGTVTITFVYTDSQGNGITYTITVINGSVNSYIAEITNPSSDFDFSTVTNIKVFLNVVDGTTGLPVKQASISLANATSESWKGFTDDLGISIFTATVASASQTTSIAVIHAGYDNVESPITGIGKLIEIGRKIAMTPKTGVVVPVDSDGDGVADEDDAYPGDATGAKKLTGAYTFGFEDQYDPAKVNFNTLVWKPLLGVYMPSGNDADFNDLVVRLSIEEKIDSQNRITAITLKAKTMAALSGANNSFGIYVNGKKYIMIVKSQVSKNPLVLADEETLVIPFAGGIARSTIGAMPYDPFMVPNGGNSLDIFNEPSEVHLASVSTTYDGVRKGNGYLKTGDKSYVAVTGFVWALMVPENWQWPTEGTCIAIAYPGNTLSNPPTPGFVNWCNTDGVQDYNWYDFPIANKVVPR
jgi:hypothetical protein